MRRFLFLACLVVLTLVSASCSTVARYRTLPPSIKAVYVPVPVNRSAESGVEERLAQYLGEEFLADGRLDLVRQGEADAIIEVEIRDFRRETQNLDGDEIVTAGRVEMESRVAIRQNIAGMPRVGGVRRVNSNLIYNADVRSVAFDPEPLWMERGLRQLARQIVQEVLTGEYREESVPGGPMPHPENGMR